MGIKMPTIPRLGSPGTDSTEAITMKIRGKGFSPGPSDFPHPFKNSPHQDAAMLADGLVANIQEAGATIMDVLDKPFAATVKFEGPHRLVDKVVSVPGGLIRSRIERIER